MTHTDTRTELDAAVAARDAAWQQVLATPTTSPKLDDVMTEHRSAARRVAELRRAVTS